MTHKTVTLAHVITTASGDTLWFVGGVGMAIFGADSTILSSQTLGATAVYGAGDVRGTQVHHSTSTATLSEFIGYNIIIRVGQSCSIHGTIDCGNTKATALAARAWGTVNFESCRWQNGSTTHFPLVTDFGHDTSHGTNISGGHVPKLSGKITKVINYQGSANSHDRVFPSFVIDTTATTPSTLWNPTQYRFLAGNTATFTNGHPNMILRSITLIPGTYDVIGVASLGNSHTAGNSEGCAVGVVPSITGMSATITPPHYPAATVRSTNATNNSIVATATVTGRITVTAEGTVDLVAEPSSTYSGYMYAKATSSLTSAKATSLTITRVF